ncbi:MAG: SHOCT domain-containing protein [Tannerella sp.]|jgi:hypothetical protein|nr:SHOCT domain-containing protein [Tannerella sp.]
MNWIVIIIIVAVLLFIVLSVVVQSVNDGLDKKIELLNKKIAAKDDFSVSKQVIGPRVLSFIFAIDDINQKILYMTEKGEVVCSYSDIISVELLENGNTKSKKSTSRTVGGAIVGGVLAGGAGAIIGGLSGGSTSENMVSSLSVKILLRDIKTPYLLIPCFECTTSVGISEPIYKIGKQKADEIRDLVSIIIDKIDGKIENNKTTPVLSISDELLKLSELKMKGILTEEEFAVQKNKILNL